MVVFTPPRDGLQHRHADQARWLSQGDVLTHLYFDTEFSSQLQFFTVQLFIPDLQTCTLQPPGGTSSFFGVRFLLSCDGSICDLYAMHPIAKTFTGFVKTLFNNNKSITLDQCTAKQPIVKTCSRPSAYGHRVTSSSLPCISLSRPTPTTPPSGTVLRLLRAFARSHVDQVLRCHVRLLLRWLRAFARTL